MTVDERQGLVTATNAVGFPVGHVGPTRLAGAAQPAHVAHPVLLDGGAAPPPGLRAHRRRGRPRRRAARRGQPRRSRGLGRGLSRRALSPRGPGSRPGRRRPAAGVAGWRRLGHGAADRRRDRRLGHGGRGIGRGRHRGARGCVVVVVVPSGCVAGGVSVDGGLVGAARALEDNGLGPALGDRDPSASTATTCSRARHRPAGSCR